MQIHSVDDICLGANLFQFDMPHEPSKYSFINLTQRSEHNFKSASSTLVSLPGQWNGACCEIVVCSEMLVRLILIDI